MPNQFNKETNSNNVLQNISGELGNKTHTIEKEKNRKINTHLKLKPFISPDGDLTIPFNSDSKYHWWKGEKEVKETIEEITEK